MQGRRGIPIQAALLAAVLVPMVASAGSAAERDPAREAVELRLPPPIVYPRFTGTDSAVVFRHETHFAAAGERCTGCHPKPFRMLAPERRVSHRMMSAGGACGACHDGKQAFGIGDRETCVACHSGMPSVQMAGAGATPGGSAAPGRTLPRPISYARSPASPGAVAFRHETHVRGKAGCAACHPKPFAMKPSKGPPGARMHEAAACGACHDGAKAFGVENADACMRCHVEGKGTP
jgi:c(7)-type cytochrome triheme protein